MAEPNPEITDLEAARARLLVQIAGAPSSDNAAAVEAANAAVATDEASTFAVHNNDNNTANRSTNQRRYNDNRKRKRGPHSHAPSPTQNRNQTHNQSADHNLPDPSLTQPAGVPMNAQQLAELEERYVHGVRNERGDLVVFKRSFVEDPWVGLGVL